MKEGHKIFKNGFVLKITKKINRNKCEIQDSTLQTLPANHKTKNKKTEICSLFILQIIKKQQQKNLY